VSPSSALASTGDRLRQKSEEGDTPATVGHKTRGARAAYDVRYMARARPRPCWACTREWLLTQKLGSLVPSLI